LELQMNKYELPTQKIVLPKKFYNYWCSNPIKQILLNLVWNWRKYKILCLFAQKSQWILGCSPFSENASVWAESSHFRQWTPPIHYGWTSVPFPSCLNFRSSLLKLLNRLSTSYKSFDGTPITQHPLPLTPNFLAPSQKTDLFLF
jgi:hypothetical protein